jgi:hypothetical protein
MMTPSRLFFAAEYSGRGDDWSAPRDIGAQYGLDVDDRRAVDRFEAADPDPRAFHCGDVNVVQPERIRAISKLLMRLSMAPRLKGK